jgi:hypothetical protein
MCIRIKNKHNMKKENYMTKTFGTSEITRELLEGLPCPIRTDGITDKQMQEMADSVEDEMRYSYPKVADKMFELWKKEKRTDEEQDFLDFDCGRAEELWLDLIERYAVRVIGAKYYPDNYPDID